MQGELGTKDGSKEKMLLLFFAQLQWNGVLGVSGSIGAGEEKNEAAVAAAKPVTHLLEWGPMNAIDYGTKRMGWC